MEETAVIRRGRKKWQLNIYNLDSGINRICCNDSQT